MTFYEEYPLFDIDVNQEKSLLVDHQIIVWHHPFYMYSAPALLKQWIDLVLEYGWAHGRDGDFLKGKMIFNTMTSGGTREVYAADSYHRFTIGEFLLPFNQTATLCKMIYLPPFIVPGTHLLTDEAMASYADLYRTLLERMIKGDFTIDAIRRFDFLNDWLDQDTGLNHP